VLADVDPFGQLSYELSHPADLALQEADRVLALDGVLEHGRVEGPSRLVGDHARGADHLPHRLEDALRAL
jgi:hypothetical protein